VILLVLSGCNKQSDLVEPYQISNQIIETMSSKAEQGLYKIQNPKREFIIYRGVEKGIEEMSYSVEDNMLTILFGTMELKQPQDYVYRIISDSSFDRIQVLIDGKSEAFDTIFLQ
jgi:hypothetical protein